MVIREKDKHDRSERAHKPKDRAEDPSTLNPTAAPREGRSQPPPTVCDRDRHSTFPPTRTTLPHPTAHDRLHDRPHDTPVAAGSGTRPAKREPLPTMTTPIR